MKATSPNLFNPGPSGLQCPLYNVQSGNPYLALYQTGPVFQGSPYKRDTNIRLLIEKPNQRDTLCP